MIILGSFGLVTPFFFRDPPLPPIHAPSPLCLPFPLTPYLPPPRRPAWPASFPNPPSPHASKTLAPSPPRPQAAGREGAKARWARQKVTTEGNAGKTKRKGETESCGGRLSDGEESHPITARDESSDWRTPRGTGDAVSGNAIFLCFIAPFIYRGLYGGGQNMPT